MDEPTQDDLFRDAVDQIVLEALAAMGENPRARFEFFKRLLAVGLDVTGSAPSTNSVAVSPARMS